MSTVATILTVLTALVAVTRLYRVRLVRRHRRAIAALHEAYRRGDYEGQLQAAEAFKISEPPARLYFPVSWPEDGMRVSRQVDVTGLDGNEF